MYGKPVIYIFFVILIVIFAYYILVLWPQSFVNPIDQKAKQALGDATGLRAVTGTLDEISSENLIFRTDEGILTIKKSTTTKYAALSNNINTEIDKNELQQNEQATVVVGVDSKNEMNALSVDVVR